MTLLSQKKIDFSDHKRFFSDPLMGALRVLSSKDTDLYVNGKRIPFYARQKDARQFFGVILDACDDSNFNLPTATVPQIDVVVAADAAFVPGKCSWVVPSKRCHAFKKKRIQKQVFALLSDIFSYKKFCDGVGWELSGNQLKEVKMRERGSKWGASEYLSFLIRENNLRFCPYCNAETIFMLKGLTNSKGESLSPFDHFYPKAAFPYLGVSLCNLIPCCAHCNSSMKGDKLPFSGRKRWPNPYEDDFNELARFKFEGDLLPALLGSGKGGLSVRIDCRYKDTVDTLDFVNSMNVERKYNQAYGVEINELPARVACVFMRAPSLLDDLLKRGCSPRLVQYVLNCTLDDRNIHKERLSKMTMDLLYDLGCMDVLMALKSIS